MSNLEQIFEREQLIEYRNKVVKEILQTEQTYVEQLQTLTDKYLDPLREVNIISSEDITKVFSVIELIRDVNKTLLKDIQERIENWSDTQCIGDVFLTLGHFLKMYSQYCANFYSATEALITLRTSNKLFRVFEDEHPLPLTNVESYLILPVQRIPRYFLLLEDFLLNTWEDHMDYANLEKAVQMIKDIADYVNGRMKTIEHMNRVYQTDLTLGGECKDLVQPHRIWIAEGELSRIRTSLISYAVPVRLYLFNDILVVAEKKITGYRYSFKVDLLETFVVADADEQKFKHSFKIVSVDISSTFSCKSEEDCNFWVQQINDTITKLLQTKGSDSRAEYQQSRASLAGSLRLEPGSSGKYKISKEHSSLDLERASSLSALNRSKIEPKIEKDDSASPKSNTNSTNVLPGVGFIPESLLPQEQHMNEFRDPKPIYEPDEQESPLESPEPQPEPPAEVELERKRPPSTSDLFKNKPLPTYSDNSPIQSPASSSVSQASQNSNTVPYSAASRSNTGAERTPLLPSSSTTTRTENSGCSCRLL